MPEYVLSLHFGAADEAQARRLADTIADTCAAEYGTRNPELHRVNRYPTATADPWRPPMPDTLTDHGEITTDDDLRDRIAAILEDTTGLADAVMAAVAPELDRLRGELADCAHEHRSAWARAQRLQAERDAARLIVEELQALRDTLYSHLDSAEAAIERVHAERAEQRQHAEQAEIAVTAHKTAIIEALQRAEQAEAEVKRLRAELDAWKARAEHAERGNIPQLREARQRAEQAEAENATLTAAVAEYQQQIAYLSGDIARAEAEVERLRAALHGHESPEEEA